MIGAPGILAGLLLPLLLQDGRRVPQAPKVGEPSTRSWAPVFTALFANSGFLRNYQFAMAMFVAFLSIYVAWFPAYLIRSLGLGLVMTGAMAGTVYMVAGVMGTIFTIKRMKTVADVSQVLHWFERSLILLIPIAILLPLAPLQWLVLPLYVYFSFLTAPLLTVLLVTVQL